VCVQGVISSIAVNETSTEIHNTNMPRVWIGTNSAAAVYDFWGSLLVNGPPIGSARNRRMCLYVEPLASSQINTQDRYNKIASHGSMIVDVQNLRSRDINHHSALNSHNTSPEATTVGEKDALFNIRVTVTCDRQ